MSVTSWAAIIAAISVLFYTAESLAKKRTKKACKKWLELLKSCRAIKQWSPNFSRVFDDVFGEKKFSISFFSRSAIASVLCLLLMLLVSFIGDAGATKHLIFIPLNKNLSIGYNLLTMIIMFFALLLNVLPDYFSLIETRLILKLIEQKSGIIKTVLFIFSDILFTTIVFFSFTIVALTVHLFVKLIYHFYFTLGYSNPEMLSILPKIALFSLKFYTCKLAEIDILNVVDLRILKSEFVPISFHYEYMGVALTEKIWLSKNPYY